MNGDIHFGVASIGESRVDAVVFPAGSENLVTLVEGQQLILALILGQVRVSRVNVKKPCEVKGNPLSPVILTQPGTYVLVAKTHAIGVRIERG